MATMTITGPLHWCRCGHGEHEHKSWLSACQVAACECRDYRRSRARRWRIDDGTTEAPWVPRSDVQAGTSG